MTSYTRKLLAWPARAWRGPRTSAPGFDLRASSVLGDARARRPFERIKYQARLTASTRARVPFLSFLDRHPLWAEMFRQEPGLHYAPLRSLFDRRLTARQRYLACVNDLSEALRLWGPTLAADIARGHAPVLFANDHLQVRLMRNRVSPHEGFWALRLRTAGGVDLFNLSFGFPASGACYVGSLQGLRRPSDDAATAIRALTKQCHGLRPHGLLLAVLQAACGHWGVERLVGVDDARQVKRRRDAARQGFVFDYGKFWASQGGLQTQADANWTLPTRPARKPLEAVPSHKRSEYRKRHALLDDLLARVADALGDPASPPAADATMKPGHDLKLLGLSPRHGVAPAPLARLWLIGATPELADWALHLAA
jgi:uncharacterized protein VirK/YbjX